MMSVPCEYSSTCFPPHTIPVKRDRQRDSWGGGEGERGKSGKKGDVIHTDRDTLMMLSDSLLVFQHTPSCVCGHASASACTHVD